MTTSPTRAAAGPAQRWRAIAVFVPILAMILALVTIQPVQAQEPPFERGIDGACLGTMEGAAPFVDVAAGDTHAAAINCLWAYGIAQGQFVGNDLVYAPHDTVTRQQMASFIARTIDILTASIYSLPSSDGEVAYDDADALSDAHLSNVDRLTDVGIVEGFPDGTFRPTDTLDRAQMASFVVRSIEEVSGETLERAPVFDDISGTHQANIEKLASIGVTVGRGAGVYAPDDPITRAQMGSFLARTLDYLVSEELLRPLAFDPGTAPATLGLVDVDVAVQDGFDRVTFAFEGDERTAGYRIQYVDEARAAGTGDAIEVDGEEILQVTLLGMALPPDLPEDLEERVLEVLNTTLRLDGDAIVEVVVESVFEGQLQVFIGTTGLQPFEVNRLDEPQRVYIDVDHAP